MPGELPQRRYVDWPDGVPLPVTEPKTEIRYPLFSLRGLVEALHLRRRDRTDPEGRISSTRNDLAYRPLLDHGDPRISVSGRGTGKELGIVYRVELNRIQGRPLGEGLPERPFNQ